MYRRVYLDMARRRLAEGDWKWLSRAVLRYPLIKLSSSLNRPLCGPVLGTVIVTYRCNYGCVMCGMPSLDRQDRDDSGEMDTAGMKEIIDQLREVGTLGVGFTGGEPMLREDLPDLLAHAVGTGMLTHLNTNGSLVAPQTARELIATGVHSVNVSIDGADAGTHDRIRRAPGAFDSAVRAVEELVRARGGGKSPRIKVVSVVMPENLEQAPAMVDLAAETGADCLEFVPEQRFAATAEGGRNSREEGNARRAEEILDRVRTRARGRLKIENSARMMALFEPSFRGEPSPVRCYAGYNSIAVDCFGRAFPCHPWANWSRPVHHLNESALKDLWHSRKYDALRREIGRCRECTLNGQAELSLLFQPLRRVKVKAWEGDRQAPSRSSTDRFRTSGIRG